MNYGPILSYQADGSLVTIAFAQGQGQIDALTPEIINVFSPLEGPDHRSKAIEGDKHLPVDLEVRREADCLWISTGKVRVRVSDGFFVDFFDAQGNAVCMDYRSEPLPLERLSAQHRKLLLSEGHSAQEEQHYAYRVVKQIQGNQHFYGLGDKTGFLDKRGYEYEMWNTDNPDPQVDCFKALYKSIPFFMALNDEHIYGIFADDHCRGYFNMGQESDDYYWFGFDGGNLDYYYIAGSSMPQILRNYTYLTGTCPLPQKWTLGYHQSRWGYMNQEDIQEVADGLRRADIPCDAIHFDIDYMDNFKVFTWNQSRYHNDPAAFLHKLGQQGFKPVAISDPGVKEEAGYPVYDEGVERGYFGRTPEGEVYKNWVWPGSAVFPDFGNPEVRTWWGGRHRFLLDQGVRGIWNDMNEPASFNGPLPDDVVFTDEDRPTTHARIHNVYGHLMAKAAYEGMKELDGRRPFVITRACYAGSQKYALCWTGDNHSIWAHLQMAIPQLCNLGLSGMPYAGTDVGGFGSDTTPELMARWVQVGCFSPLFRNHSAVGTRRQEPWLFGQEVLDIYRKYVKLRYSLIPYFYDLFFEGEQSGAPIMRPLVFHYGHDETARTCNDEFLLGENLLVAPVVLPGMTRRLVYLPEGTWFDYWTGETHTGGWLIREAPLDLCPMYVKAGAILPRMEDQSYVSEKPLDTLILDVYPGQGSYDHYLDNGEDFAYREGAYHHYRFTVDEDGQVTGRILHAGFDRPYKRILVRRPDGSTQELTM